MIDYKKYPILTAKQMQMADYYTIHKDEISSLNLMEAAGQAVAFASNKLKLDGGRVVIIVGRGNNGGDGFVAARLLRQKRVAVTVIPLFSLESLQDDAALQAELAINAGVKIRPATSVKDLPCLQSWLSRAVVVVDAIFGTGLTRPIDGWVAQAIHSINQADRPILSVDIASGIHTDTGDVLGAAINANATLPIAAYKWGHWLHQGKEYSGTMLTPARIGVSLSTLKRAQIEQPIHAASSMLIHQDMIQQAFPKRVTNAYKQSFGHLWVFGGSVGYTGAPKLAAMGAQAVGVGLVSIACPNDVYTIIASSSLEAMVHPQEHANITQANAIVAGPGWGESYDMLMHILQSNRPTILDADALNLLATSPELHTLLHTRSALTVLTPHPGEAAHLLGLSSKDIQKDRLSSALALIDKFHVWVVLKGAHTLIVSPQKHVWLNPFGSVNLAVAGTGDILAGMIGGLLAGNIEPEVAIPAAVGLHGLVGEQKHWHKAGQLELLIAQKVEELRH